MGSLEDVQLLAVRTCCRPEVRADRWRVSQDRWLGEQSVRTAGTAGYLENIWVAGSFRFLPDI